MLDFLSFLLYHVLGWFSTSALVSVLALQVWAGYRLVAAFFSPGEPF